MPVFNRISKEELDEDWPLEGYMYGCPVYVCPYFDSISGETKYDITEQNWVPHFWLSMLLMVHNSIVTLIYLVTGEERGLPAMLLRPRPSYKHWTIVAINGKRFYRL